MELCEALQAQLLEQKKEIVEWAAKIDHVRIREWLDNWEAESLTPNVQIRKLVKNQEIAELSIFEYGVEFVSAAKSFERAVEKFISGEVDGALKLAFSVIFLLGYKAGRKAQVRLSSKEKSDAVHRNTYASKRMLLEYYVKMRFETFSNEQAAKEVAKANLVKIAHRTLAAYIAECKKLLQACDQSDAGISIIAIYKEALKKMEKRQQLDAKQLSEVESVLKWVDEIRIKRVSHLMSSGLERAKLIVPLFEQRSVETFLKGHYHK